MAQYTFLLFYEYMIDLKNENYIIHLEKYDMKNIMLVDARGVINLAHEMRQNTETCFTRKREYFNTLFKKLSITKHLSFNHKTMQLYFEMF